MKDSNDPSPSPIHSQQHPFFKLIAEHHLATNFRSENNMGEPTWENQFTVIDGDDLRIAHRNVDTETYSDSVKWNPRLVRIFSPLCSVDYSPLLSLSNVRRLQQFSIWDDS